MGKKNKNKKNAKKNGKKVRGHYRQAILRLVNYEDSKLLRYILETFRFIHSLSMLIYSVFDPGERSRINRQLQLMIMNQPVLGVSGLTMSRKWKHLEVS